MSTAKSNPKLSETLQMALLEISARVLTHVLAQHHSELDPKYIWRLKGAIRLLQGQNPDRKRG